MPYLWEMPYKGANLYESALLEAVSATNQPYHLTQKGVDNLDAILKSVPGAKHTAPATGTDPHILLVDISDEKTKNLMDKLTEKGFVVNPSAPPAPTAEEHKTTGIDAFIKRFPEDVQHDLKIALQCVSHGKWLDGSNLDTPEKQQMADKISAALQSKEPGQVAEAIKTVVSDITGGKVKVDENNDKLFKKADKEKSVSAPVEMPALFQSEPDDSMWQDIVVTAYGIPLINMDHPVSKKVLASENPEEECPNDLKQFKKAVYENKRLQNVFGKGGFIERICAGKLTNLLTLGIAAATVDAGKRADRIIKELKDKGGMTTHRNLLIAKYDNIVDADPDNEGATVVVRPYNRSRGELMGEIEVPASMLNRFYSVVDPTQSAKAYLEIYAKDTSLMENSRIFSGDALLEGPISAIKNAASTFNSKGKLSTIFKGDKSDNQVNQPTEEDKAKKGEVANLKAKFIEKIQEIGHPPYYVLKPKTANKEIDIVSNGSTGQFHGGKVLMVTMRIDEHKAAAFMTPKEVKQYFAL